MRVAVVNSFGRVLNPVGERIYCHPQTDCFVISQLFSVARHVGCFKLGSKPAQLYVRLSIISLSQQMNYVNSVIIKHYVVDFVCLHFCLSR